MTIEEYNENKKICLFVFKKYFSGYSKYKDDLIQSGLINICKYLENFNEEKSGLITFKVICARYGMSSFLSSVFYRSKTLKGKNLRLDINAISFETILTGTDNFKVEDSVEDIKMKDYFDNIANNDCLRQCIDNALKQFCRYKDISLKTLSDYNSTNYVRKRKVNFNQKKYDIIKYYVQCQNIVETAKKFNVSRQFVSQCKIDFAKCLKDELIKGGYYEN